MAQPRVGSLLAALLLSVSSVAAPAYAADAALTPERGLSNVLQAVEANKLDLALDRVDSLIKAYPNFRLAYLIRGDLLLAHTQPLHTFGNVSKMVPPQKVEDLREEALARLRALRDKPPSKLVPGYVLQLYPEQKHVIIVDSSRSRLYVFANAGGRPQLIADYYVTIGKRGVEKTRQGDQRTPIGVYHVTADLSRQKLSDLYGVGAYPINYPNEWDRRLGRDGSGIWLHGTPSNTYSRPPRASDGCIVLSNRDLEAVGKDVQVGLTPVIIAEHIEWTDAHSLDAERNALDAALESWRKDWESRDLKRYLRHYSSRFRSRDENLAGWIAHKRRVNANKSWIKVGVSRIAMFRYPRERGFVVVTFEQNYRSNNLSNTMRKRQYWVREGGDWKIIYEGPA